MKKTIFKILMAVTFLVIPLALSSCNLGGGLLPNDPSNNIHVYYYGLINNADNNPTYQIIKEENVSDLKNCVFPDVIPEFYTDIYHYTFCGWDEKDMARVNDNEYRFRAQYDSIEFYTVTFFDYNGNVKKVQKVDYGMTATPPTDKEMEIDGLTFMGWDKEYNNVTEDLDVHPIYKEARKSIKVVFYGYLEDALNRSLTASDYKPISEQYVSSLSEVAYPEVKTVYDLNYSYEFYFWADFVLVNLNEYSCKANYLETECCTVVFYDYDGEVISTQRLRPNESATAPDMSLYPVEGYEFKGWDKEYTNVQTSVLVHPIYEETSGEEEYLIKEPTEILIETAFNDAYGQVLKDAANDLMKKEPNLTINYERITGGYDALKDDIISDHTSGDFADVTVIYPHFVPDFIEAGIQLDVTEYINNEDYGLSEDELEDFYDAYLEDGNNYTIEGTYSLPLAKTTDAMYYDADKILGLVLPGVNNGNAINEEYINNLTWEELFDVFCPALLAYRETLPTDEAKKAFLDTDTYSDWALVGYDSEDNLFIELAEQCGYGYASIDKQSGTVNFDFVNDGMKNLMKTFNEACKNHYFTTKGIIGTYINYRSTVDAILFSIGSTGGVNYQFSSSNPKKLGVAPIPHMEGKELKMVQQGPSYVMLNHEDDNRALASWLFYKELTKTQNQVEWCMTTSYAPIKKSVANSDEYLALCDESQFEPRTLDHLKALNARYVANITDYLFSPPVFKGSSSAYNQLGGIVIKAVGAESLTDDSLDVYFQNAYTSIIDYLNL